MDWSEEVVCIKCNKSGNLLVCGEDGCPLAVHVGCMGSPARFDDAGCFYCPYCYYKKAVAESRKAREHALETKKALLLFMDGKMMGSEKHIEEKKRAESNVNNESNENFMTCDNGKSAKGNATLDQSIQPDKEEKITNADEEEVQKDESEGSKLHVNEVSKNNQEEDKNISNEEEIQNQEEQSIASRGEKNREEEHEDSASSSGQNPSRNMPENNMCDVEEEKIQEDKCDTSSSLSSGSENPSLTVHARITTRSKRKKCDSEAILAQASPAMKKKTSPTTDSPRRSSRKPTSAMKTKESKQLVDTSKRDSGLFGKRRRLLWSEEEEEAIKSGVQVFSKEAHVNIPWRKILLMGEKVFDATRTPTDLRDKWKNMLKEEKK